MEWFWLTLFKGCNRKYVPKHRGLLYLVVIAVIMFFALLLGALGVHMVIIVTVLGLALSPETLGFILLPCPNLLEPGNQQQWFVPLLP